MVIAAVVGAVAAGLGFPVRILVEGLFTNLDLAILFVLRATLRQYLFLLRDRICMLDSLRIAG